jgi:thiol-disulfide isomerase/thioredoxin
VTAKKRFGVQFASIFFVVGFLVLLAFLPKWTRRTQFQFDSVKQPSAGEKAVFPMDHAFVVVTGAGNLPAGLKGRKQVTLGDLAVQSPGGLLVNFWATWCPPCLDELPALDYLNRQLHRQSREKLPLLVTISVDELGQDVTGLFETLDFSPTVLVLHDPNGYFSARMGTTRFPETYWVEPGGAVRYKWVGPQNWLSEEVLGTLQAQARI